MGSTIMQNINGLLSDVNKVSHAANSVLLINPISEYTETRARTTDLSSSTHVSIKLSNNNYAYVVRNNKVHLFISKEEAAAKSSLGYIIDMLKYINVKSITIHVPRLYDWLFRLVNIVAADKGVRIVAERFVKPIEFWESETSFRLHIETSETTDISHYRLYNNFDYIQYDYDKKSFVMYGRSYSWPERKSLMEDKK